MIGTFADDMLEVDDGHRLYVEQAGDPEGVAAVWIHGGPGAGFRSSAFELFEGGLHRAVCYDQRAAGRSTPHAADDDVDWSTIDMDRHVEDLETIRRSLGIERWIVSGASWGSVLGLTYAQRHVDRVLGVVVAAVGTGGRAEIDYLTEHGASYAPGPWHRFHDYAAKRYPGSRLVEAYRRMVMDPDPGIHVPAAQEWCRWEDAHVNVDDDQPIDGFVDSRFRDPRYRLGFARQVTHCWAADSWLKPNELVQGALAMSSVPCIMVHGERDRSSPLGPAQHLHESWPGSRLIVTDDGHGGDSMWRHVAIGLRELASA